MIGALLLVLGAAAAEPLAVDAAALRARITGTDERVRVYSFWASWCGPCIAEFPMLKAFAAAHPTVHLELVNVDHQAVQATKVPKLVELHGLGHLAHTWLVSDDPNRALTAAVDQWPSAIPVALVVRPDGQRVGLLVETISLDALSRTVRRAVDEPAGAPAPTTPTPAAPVR